MNVVSSPSLADDHPRKLALLSELREFAKPLRATTMQILCTRAVVVVAPLGVVVYPYALNFHPKCVAGRQCPCYRAAARSSLRP